MGPPDPEEVRLNRLAEHVKSVKEKNPELGQLWDTLLVEPEPEPEVLPRAYTPFGLRQKVVDSYVAFMRMRQRRKAAKKEAAIARAKRVAAKYGLVH